MANKGLIISLIGSIILVAIFLFMLVGALIFAIQNIGLVITGQLEWYILVIFPLSIIPFTSLIGAIMGLKDNDKGNILCKISGIIGIICSIIYLTTWILSPLPTSMIIYGIIITIVLLLIPTILVLIGGILGLKEN